jgi:23S rRNA-/tRNA-specific pseudouridylate synthase
VHVKIETWRMHQIRVHLAHAWYPVVGDIVYGNPVINRKLYKQCGIKRQLLHCQTYEFIDEQWTKRTFTAPLPADMQRLQTR